MKDRLKIRTIALLVEYNGKKYAGWQRQKNDKTVQEELEKVLSRILETKMNVIGAGRTDSGVHARGQVAHSCLFKETRLTEHKIYKGMNSYLPYDICVNDVRILDYDFHSTRDAIAREYSYSMHTKSSIFLNEFSAFYKYPINLSILNESAEIFKGEHDFTTYSKNNRAIENYVCNILECNWTLINEYRATLKIRANRFVYGMVRALVGVMLDYGRKKKSLDEIISALNSKDRSYASPLAPSQGLILEKVTYPEILNPFK